MSGPTNLQIITTAYRFTGIIDETQQPSAEQGEVGLWKLNNLLADWAADSIYLGWYKQTNLQNTAPLREGSLRAVEACLAGELANHFGVTLEPDKLSLINEEYTKLVRRTRPLGEADLSELPRPQGPRWSNGGFWG